MIVYLFIFKRAYLNLAHNFSVIQLQQHSKSNYKNTPRVKNRSMIFKILFLFNLKHSEGL